MPFDITFDLDRDARISDVARVRELIRHIDEFGVEKDDLFHPKDLTELRNIPRVCRCLEQLMKMTNQV